MTSNELGFPSEGTGRAFERRGEWSVRTQGSADGWRGALVIPTRGGHLTFTAEIPRQMIDTLSHRLGDFHRQLHSRGRSGYGTISGSGLAEIGAECGFNFGNLLGGIVRGASSFLPGPLQGIANGLGGMIQNASQPRQRPAPPPPPQAPPQAPQGTPPLPGLAGLLAALGGDPQRLSQILAMLSPGRIGSVIGGLQVCGESAQLLASPAGRQLCGPYARDLRAILYHAQRALDMYAACGAGMADADQALVRLARSPRHHESQGARLGSLFIAD